MKKLFLFAPLLLLASCGDRVGDVQGNGSVPVTAPSNPVVDSVVLGGERAFGYAETLYTVAAEAMVIPVKAGAFNVDQLKKIKALNQQATAILVKGKQTADVAEKARLAAQLLGIRDALALIKGDR